MVHDYVRIYSCHQCLCICIIILIINLGVFIIVNSHFKQKNKPYDNHSRVLLYFLFCYRIWFSHGTSLFLNIAFGMIPEKTPHIMLFWSWFLYYFNTSVKHSKKQRIVSVLKVYKYRDFGVKNMKVKWPVLLIGFHSHSSTF